MGTDVSKEQNTSGTTGEPNAETSSRPTRASAIPNHPSRVPLFPNPRGHAIEPSASTVSLRNLWLSQRRLEKNNRIKEHIREVAKVLNGTSNDLVDIMCRENNPNNWSIKCRKSLLLKYSEAYREHTSSVKALANESRISIEGSPDWVAIFVLWLYTGCIHDLAYFDSNEPDQADIPRLMEFLDHDPGVAESLRPWLNLATLDPLSAAQEQREKNWNVVGPWACWIVGESFEARGFQDEMMEHIFTLEDIHPIKPAIALEVYDHMPRGSKLREYFADVLALKWYKLYLHEFHELENVWDSQWYDLCLIHRSIVMDQDRRDIQRSRQGWPRRHVKPWSLLVRKKYLFRFDDEIDRDQSDDGAEKKRTSSESSLMKLE